MSSTEVLLEQTNNIRAKAVSQPRVSVTELARSNKWRQTLVKDKVMEVIDRGNQVGWLLSPEGMQAMLDTMDYFETELERVQIAYIVAQRDTDGAQWLSGEELREGALDALPDRYKKLKAAFDGV